MRPRIYNANAETFEERQKRQQRKQALWVKKVHRRRLNLIMGVFACAFLFFSYQISVKIGQTHKLTQQVQTSKTTLVKVTKQRQKLNAKKLNLEDPNYVAKLIRSKFYYSKPDEKIYNIPEGNNN